jgi:hypothetical protein
MKMQLRKTASTCPNLEIRTREIDYSVLFSLKFNINNNQRNDAFKVLTFTQEFPSIAINYQTLLIHADLDSELTLFTTSEIVCQDFGR